MCYNDLMKTVVSTLVIAVLFLTTACGQSAPEVDPAYQAEIEAAWAEREAALTAEDGWLTLTGLTWLKPGDNTLGAAQSSDVWLPDGAADAGKLVLNDDGTVHLVPLGDANLTVNDAPAAERALALDSSGSPDLVRSGRALFYLIARGQRIGVRVKDPESPTRREFTGIDHFPVDPSYRITAVFEPYAEPKEVTIPTVIGEPSITLAPGLLRFEIAGEERTLQPTVSTPDDRNLFIVFRDATAGDTTYGAGRFLSAELTENNNEVVLDFNLAVNPPCAFTPYATCPLPTPENTLLIHIEAGEMYSGDTH